jgi:hypothetical protein
VKTPLRAPTRYEAERIEALRKLGCVACAVLEVPNISSLELHHILSGGVRMGHWFTIFLCRGHHQGDWNGCDWIDAPQRVAVSDGRKRFVAVYGSERALWERCQDRLRLSKAWPISKILPRRGTYAQSTAGLVASGQSQAPAGQISAGSAGNVARHSGETA